MRTNQENGFSLVELIIAMAVTLIVTGAMYGLLSGGQSAFRREPELSDRQQNIRLSMDMIMRDVSSAGASMPPFVQAFRIGLDGGTIAACVDNAGATVTCPVAPSGANADELEILANPQGFEPEQTCDYPGGSSSNVRLIGGTTRIPPGPPYPLVMIFLTDGTWTMRSINGGINTPAAGDGNCVAGQPHANIQFMNGGDTTGMNLPSGLCAGTWNGTQCGNAPGNACTNTVGCKVQSVLLGQIVRYRIRNGSDGVPNLERFASSTSADLGATGIPQFQVIARGIDDLQVQYTNASAAVTDNAPIVLTPTTVAAWTGANSPITRVQVTLSARSEARNVAGARTVTSGPAALRGQLTSSGTPRSALATLGGPLAPRASGSPPPWF